MSGVRWKDGAERARALRRRATPEEDVLWKALRGGQLGVKFRRQQPLGHYIADFVCFDRGLVIELDGLQHLGDHNDAVRDEYLRARGFRVLRFWNNDIRENLPAVLHRIRPALTK